MIGTLAKPGQRLQRPSWPFVVNGGTPLARGLVFFFGGEPGSGLYCGDSANVRQKGTVNGTVTWTGPTLGGRGLLFDGSTGFVNYPYHNALDFGTGDFSVFCWLRHGTLGDYKFTFAKGIRDQEFRAGWCIYVTTNGLAHVQLDSGSAQQTLDSTTAINDSRWHLVGWTRQGTTWTLYVDGRSEASGTNSYNVSNTSYGFRLGTESTGSRKWGGDIADMRVWRRPLTAGEVWQLYHPATRWDLYWRPTRRWFPQVAGESVTVDRWWVQPAALLQRRRPLRSLDLAEPLSQSGESVTVDRWQPVADRAPRGQRWQPHQAWAGPADDLPDTPGGGAGEDQVWPLPETVLARRRLPLGWAEGLTRPLADDPLLRLFQLDWWQPASEPVRRTPLARHGYIAFLPDDSDLRPFGVSWQPQSPGAPRRGRLWSLGEVAFAGDPAGFIEPGVILLDYWWQPASEPIRKSRPAPPGLGGGLSPPETVGESVTVDRWWVQPAALLQRRLVLREPGLVWVPEIVSEVLLSSWWVRSPHAPQRLRLWPLGGVGYQGEPADFVAPPAVLVDHWWLLAPVAPPRRFNWRRIDVFAPPRRKNAVHYDAVLAVRDEIRGLSLDSLPSVQIVARKLPSDRGLTLPGIVCSYPPEEGETWGPGTNEREDPGFPVMVTIVAAENQNLDWDAVTERYALWRQEVMLHFMGLRLPTVTEVYVCRVEHRAIINLDAFIERNLFAGALVVRAMARMART